MAEQKKKKESVKKQSQGDKLVYFMNNKRNVFVDEKGGKKHIAFLPTMLLICIALLIFIPLVQNFVLTIQNRMSIAQLEHVIKEFESNDTALYAIKNGNIYLQGQDKAIKKETKIKGTGYLFINTKKESTVRVNHDGYCFTKDSTKSDIHISKGKCSKMELTYYSTSKEQKFIAPIDSDYTIELWGAVGGRSRFIGRYSDRSGGGAYTKGDLALNENESIYIQVGGKGGTCTLSTKAGDLKGPFGYPSFGGKGGYNGGADASDMPRQASCSGGGGGATDVRLTSGAWDNFDSLKSRIMVAAGGGGATYFGEYESGFYTNSGTAGAGGSLEGQNGIPYFPRDTKHGLGATQVAGYAFGKGGPSDSCKNFAVETGGGAGGYYGSYSGACNPSPMWYPHGGAGGGSSFVSGCKGCNAITQNSTVDNIIPTNQAIHYSKKVFQNIEMHAGDEKMPAQNGHQIMIGNRVDGYAKISFEVK